MDKKTFSVRRAAALVLALVMVLCTMTVMVFAADKVSVDIKGLHNAQLNDVKLYTYENGEKGTEDLLADIETVADGYAKMYENIELTPGEYWVDGYDTNNDCNGGLAFTVTDNAEQTFTFCRAYAIYASNSGWLKGTDYTITMKITGKDGTVREGALGTATYLDSTRTSCLFMSGDTVAAILTPIGERVEDFAETTVSKSGNQTTSAIDLYGKVAQKQSLTVNAPAGSTVTAGAFHTYYVYDVADCQTVADGETSVTLTVPEKSKGNYFVRVQHPNGVTWWDFYTSLPADGVTVTKDDLYIGSDEFTKDTIYRYKKNVYDRADIYLGVNGDGYLSMDVGETFELNVFRNWMAIESYMNAKVGLPDMHYSVIDEAGNPSDIITIEPTQYNASLSYITANKTGTAIVLVTYDAMSQMQGQSSTASKQFSAIWPECTGVFVVTVGEDGTHIEKNMLIDRTEGKTTALDAEHDILFYLGSEGAEYSFTPELGSTVTVDRSVVGDEMTFDGFTDDGVTVDRTTHEVTVTGLTTGRHIIKVEKGGVANYQVVTVREVSYDLQDSTGAAISDPGTVKAGDTIKLQFHNLVNPKEKLSGAYNFNASLYYTGEDGTTYRSIPGGYFGVYDFSGNPERQLITITLPKYWIEDTYDLTGVIKMAGWPGVPTHRGVSYTVGTGMVGDAPNVGMNLSRLPELSLAVDSSNLMKVQLHFKDETGKTVAVSSDEITIQDSSNVKSMLTAEERFGAVAGDFTYAVSKAGYEAANGSLNVSESALDFTITLTRTADKIAAEEVEGKIASLGTVTKNSGERLAAARKAYGSLTDEQKAFVGNLGTLEAAERRYENVLEANNAGVTGKVSVRKNADSNDMTAEDADGGEAGGSVSYGDVKSGDWFASAVQSMTKLGLMTGTGNGSFSPTTATTRAMILTVLARMDGEDTSGALWYAAGRAWAIENGISDGSNLNGKLTREQLCAMLYRYAQSKGYDTQSGSTPLNGYSDYSSLSAYAQDAMGWAVNAGLVQGRSGSLAPQANATRAEIAVILDRFLTNIVE